MSWQEEFRDSFKDQESLFYYLDTDSNFDLNYSSFIPKNFAKKIKEAGKNSPLWNQFVPTHEEAKPTGLIDPIGDKDKYQGGGIIHRYKNRALFTPTNICPVSCRYCFRKNELNEDEKMFKGRIENLTQYLYSNPDINEVILTGGDPLVLSNQRLEYIFEELLSSGVQFVRIHTRTPIIIPSRIDSSFLSLLEKYQFKFKKILFVLHTNHISELTSDTAIVLNSMSKLNIERLTQSVLLKGVNDSTQALLNLFNKVIELNFRPYYLHHPDQVKGGAHFYLSLEEGRKLYAPLRDQLSGWMLPEYIIDQPTGLGKQSAFNPESFEFSGFLLDRSGKLNTYKSSFSNNLVTKEEK